MIAIPVGRVALAAAVAGRRRRPACTARLRGVSAVSETRGVGERIRATRSSGPTDGGATWTRLPSPSTDRLDFRDIDADRASTTAYVLSIGNGPASRIYKTTDAGAHVDAAVHERRIAEAFFDAMAFWDADHGIAVSDSVEGRVRHHHDRGRRQDVDARAGRSAAAGACRTKAPSPPAART